MKVAKLDALKGELKKGICGFFGSPAELQARLIQALHEELQKRKEEPQPKAATKLFMSYRRDDSEHVTGRIYDRLEAHFGRENVFFDIDRIPVGVDFRAYLDQAVSQCEVLLAVIGEHWLGARFTEGPKEGQRRLEDPEDFVRIEIESALARGIKVIPVLVGKARMPREQELPEGLRPLTYRNAAEVRSGRDFHAHVDRLIRGIESLIR